MKSLGFLTIAAGASAVLLAMTGCTPDPTSGQSNPDPTETISMPVVKAAADKVPDKIREKGKLIVAIPTNEPPTQYYKEGTETLVGINPSIAELVAGALDLELDVQVANFDSIIPGIAANRYDMTVSSMTPTKERMETLDFVDYMQMGNSLAVPADNPENIKLDSLCGKKVGVLTGSFQLTARVPEMDKKCEAKSEEAIDIEQFKDTRQAISALTSNRIVAVFADSPILGFAASQDNPIEISESADFDAVGVGLSKENDLVKAVKPAMDEIIKSEEYKKALAAYGQDDAVITDARLNFAQ